jgi:hypothetical protein
MWRPRRGQVPGWIADFLGLPPLGGGATFADERRRRVLEADILTRTSRLARHGWAGVFDTLSPYSSWLGGGRLQINGYEFLPDRDLSQARQLDFVPVHSYTGRDMLELPHRYALVYPVSGALADTGSVRAGPDGLARLIGPNRARVLQLLYWRTSLGDALAASGR